ncbi:hypothetical protein GVX82_00145, partial [Patescibacteria group bacterium]|nr:hypothetical protein [Patescibacteria group bacterium]
MKKLSELPRADWPREKLERLGPDNLTDTELLAILLRIGTAGRDVLEIAADVLKKHPKCSLLSVSYHDLAAIKGLDSGKVSTLLAAFELTRRLMDAHQSGR